MDKVEILKRVDHTVLKQTTRLADIERLIDEAAEYGVASVCIPPSYVEQAVAYSDGRVRVCTVIGFPNGYSSSASKAFEAREAVLAGAEEIDAVINLCDVKNGDFDKVLDELVLLRNACENKVLKVIIETAMLTDEEKVKLCSVVSEAKADYIKTSTGFGGGGATVEDVALMRKNCPPQVKVKASGGICSFEDAEMLIAAGADRLGTSALVKLFSEGK